MTSDGLGPTNLVLQTLIDIRTRVSLRKTSTVFLQVLQWFRSLLSLGLPDGINDGVQEDTTDADGAAKQLDGVKRLSEHDGDTNNDDDTLGGVGDRLRGKNSQPSE